MTLNNPFESLSPKVKPQDVEYDEWGGQFSCQTPRCNGYATVARYLKKQHLLTWQCQEGHISRMEDVDE
jgi:hypothetical protein